MVYLNRLFYQLEQLGLEYNVVTLALAVMLVYYFLIHNTASRRY